MAHESAYFKLGRTDGRHDAKTLKKGLDALPGVMSVSVNLKNGNVAVDYDDTGVTQAQIQRQVESLGFPIHPQNTDGHTHCGGVRPPGLGGGRTPCSHGGRYCICVIVTNRLQ